MSRFSFPKSKGDWESSIKPAIVGGAVGTVFGIAAFLLLTSHPGMGQALFLLVPVAAGFSIALVSRGSTRAAAAGLLAVLCSLVILIATGKEGMLCATLAIPIVLAGLSIGLGVGIVVKKLLVDSRDRQTTTMGLLLLIAPASVLVGDRIERPNLKHPRIEVIRDSVTVKAPPERVWDHIIAIDNVQTSKPLLMYIGLPIPKRCTLQGQGVGAKRTCYFNSGSIEETITGWNPPYYMSLSIDQPTCRGDIG